VNLVSWKIAGFSVGAGLDGEGSWINHIYGWLRWEKMGIWLDETGLAGGYHKSRCLSEALSIQRHFC